MVIGTKAGVLYELEVLEKEKRERVFKQVGLFSGVVRVAQRMLDIGLSRSRLRCLASYHNPPRKRIHQAHRAAVSRFNGSRMDLCV